MTADETDPTRDEPSAAPAPPAPSVAPPSSVVPEQPVPDAPEPGRADDPTSLPQRAPLPGDADPAPVPVESDGLARILADPEIAPARDDAELARLLASPEAAAPAEETPGLAAILADPDPALFGEPASEARSGTEAAPDTAQATGHPSAPGAAVRQTWDSRRDAKPPRADPTPAGVVPADDADPVPPTGLPLPALPPERPGPPLSAPEAGRGGYPGLVALVFLILVVLLVGAVVLIAVLIANAAWPFPVAAALTAVLPPL
ncbi:MULTISPECIES: hypothetical protein [unclassified Microbacterium]|uniref:hypothetical protein n=1 Tax=unclassified Microbacterium TaxID=2609290 RepID=UPI0036568AA1